MMGDDDQEENTDFWARKENKPAIETFQRDVAEAELWKAVKDGTIELKTELYDYSTHRFGFDMEGFDYELLDTEPQVETRNIIDAVNTDIFINELESEMNKLNFVMLRNR